MKCSLCLAGWKADGRKGPGSDKLSLCERCPVATEANHTPRLYEHESSQQAEGGALPLY